MRLEASDYLFKPIEPKSLREAVQQRLIESEVVAQEAVRLGLNKNAGVAAQSMKKGCANLALTRCMGSAQESRPARSADAAWQCDCRNCA